MPKLPIFRFGSAEPPPRPELQFQAIVLALTDLQLGVDNLRYDVHLSPRVTDEISQHLARYIRMFGGVESLLEMDVPNAARASFMRAPAEDSAKLRKTGPGDLKALLVSLHQAILNRAKSQENPSIDILGRLAVVKFIRTELHAQFARILEQCRMKSKSLEGLRQAKMMETQEVVTSFQVRKKIIQRKAGQEIFRLLREIEKETLARTRRSFFGDLAPDTYRLFLNPLILTEDGRDDYLCAEHYYMFGNFDKDPDRFANLRQLALNLLRDLGYEVPSDDKQLEQALNVPENAATLVGTGDATNDESDASRERKDRLDLWTKILQKENVLPHVMASYEAVALLGEYTPRVNPQQLKNALISREECARVERIIAEGRLPADRLHAAVGRVSSARGAERTRIAARLLRDLFCYHRDLRGLEAITAGLDSVNLITDHKVRELSSLNGMLYEFLPPEEQRAAEDRVLHHVILKADIRDSSRLTRSLMEKGMNAASYFSLNFYEPVNKLLAKYGATKVFLEGDAIIVAVLEREGEAMLAVSRACVLAWEILSLLRGYNELLERSGLPQMELGLGIAYQDSAPLYLMDGDHRIMISDAINESDRLSSCNKRVRKKLAPDAGLFRVYTFQIAADSDGGSSSEDVTINYNVSGICLSGAAFRKLQAEISLSPWKANFKGFGFEKNDKRWTDDQREFFVGTVPLANGAFRKIAIRKSRIAQVDVRDFSLLHWTDRFYFEVCADPAVYAALPGEKSAVEKG
jgi:class 3 adenylate cyclase